MRIEREISSGFSSALALDHPPRTFIRHAGRDFPLLGSLPFFPPPAQSAPFNNALLTLLLFGFSFLCCPIEFFLTRPRGKGIEWRGEIDPLLLRAPARKERKSNNNAGVTL